MLEISVKTVKMTNEWIDWTDSRLRPPLRTGCNAFLNNNNSYNSKCSSLGNKMKTQQLRVKGKLFIKWICGQIIFTVLMKFPNIQ